MVPLKKIIGWRVVAQTCFRILSVLLAMAHAGFVTASESTPTPSPAFAVPTLLDDGWEREDPAKAGFDVARLRQLAEGIFSAENNIHSVIVERHGKLVAERYRRGNDKQVFSIFAREVEFGPTILHDTRSVGKSIISLLIGVAIEKKKIKSLQTPVIDFYPEYADLATSELKAVTLEHLLTMSSGLEWNEGGAGRDDEHRLMWKWSPVYYVLSRPIVTPPGQKFNYNSGGTAVLADILTRATGMHWQDYARTVLFEPLAIRDLTWTTDWHGRPMAFTGLRMRPRDMAKIGRLMLNKGFWNGAKPQQVVPADWIANSLQPKLGTGFDGTRYGYHWWIGTADWKSQSIAWGAAFGNGGQRICIAPELDMAIVITAGAYNDFAVARRVNAFCRDIASAVRGDGPRDSVGR
jgi:CubicO group peptidase (beta-lactamase class C family)